MGGGLDGNFSDSELNEYEEKPYDVIHLNINYLDRVHIKNCGKTLSLGRMLQERDQVHHTIREETRKLQRIVRDHIKVYEHRVELEKKKQQLDSWSEELKKRETLIETERQKLEETKMKSDSSKSVLQLALKEQRKNVLRLFEEQKREKEAALEKVLELERSSKCEKRNLELEIKLLRAELAVAKLVGNGVNDDDDDASIQQKIDGMPTIRQEAFKKLVAVRHLKC
ncbi:hypothetical protein OROGR_004884 [Orobanche gracilis]